MLHVVMGQKEEMLHVAMIKNTVTHGSINQGQVWLQIVQNQLSKNMENVRTLMVQTKTFVIKNILNVSADRMNVIKTNVNSEKKILLIF